MHGLCRVTALWCWISISPITPICQAQQASTVDQTDAKQEGRHYLEEWRREREKLEWAEFEVDGTIEDFKADQSTVVKLKQHSLISPGVECHRSDWGNGNAAVWLEYPDRIVQWCYGGGNAAVIGIHRLAERNRQHARLIDPRLVSLFGNSAIPDSRPSFPSAALGLTFGATITAIRNEKGLQVLT